MALIGAITVTGVYAGGTPPKDPTGNDPQVVTKSYAEYTRYLTEYNTDVARKQYKSTTEYAYQTELKRYDNYVNINKVEAGLAKKETIIKSEADDAKVLVRSKNYSDVNDASQDVHIINNSSRIDNHDVVIGDILNTQDNLVVYKSLAVKDAVRQDKLINKNSKSIDATNVIVTTHSMQIDNNTAYLNTVGDNLLLTNSQVNRNTKSIKNLNRGMAGFAATTALSLDAGEVGIGLGYFNGDTGVAIGAAFADGDRGVLSVNIASDIEGKSVSAGTAFKIKF